MQDTHHANQLPEAPNDHDDHLADFDPADFEPREIQLPAVRRTLTVLAVLIALGIALALPPLLNVNRFRRQIASSISSSLGRPVHMDQVTLNLLPTPGFTLENFVVGEDPSFGTEPVIHANSVRAHLRVRSLWRRRVEFSRISLTDTSFNLVHRADGRWNVESILLQASRIEAAPTSQSSGGSAPRFPYIEATNARVNVKMGLEKMPLSLTETEFALWLPQPQQWRLRLLGHPTRTDNAASDTGLLRLQGTLGKAGTLAEVPVELSAEWSGAPLGAVSWVLLGHDADVRGDMTLNASTTGTLGRNLLSLRLGLRGARRAEFVPARSLDLDIACKARAEEVFHRLDDLHCAAPADSPSPAIALTGSIPQAFSPATATLQAHIQQADAAFLLDAMRLASPHISPALRLSGSLNGEFALTPPAGDFTLTSPQLRLGDISFISIPSTPATFHLAKGKLSFGPFPLALGGTAAIEAQADHKGYSLHLTGTALRSRVLVLADALPQFGDGLATALPLPPASSLTPEAPLHLDLVSTRTWNNGQLGTQTWTPATPHPAPTRRTPSRHRR